MRLCLVEISWSLWRFELQTQLCFTINAYIDCQPNTVAAATMCDERNGCDGSSQPLKAARESRSV